MAQLNDPGETRDIDPMSDQCWASVANAGPTLIRHRIYVSGLLGRRLNAGPAPQINPSKQETSSLSWFDFGCRSKTCIRCVQNINYNIIICSLFYITGSICRKYAVVAMKSGERDYPLKSDTTLSGTTTHSRERGVKKNVLKNYYANCFKLVLDLSN